MNIISTTLLLILSSTMWPPFFFFQNPVTPLLSMSLFLDVAYRCHPHQTWESNWCPFHCHFHYYFGKDAFPGSAVWHNHLVSFPALRGASQVVLVVKKLPQQRFATVSQNPCMDVKSCNVRGCCQIDVNIWGCLTSSENTVLCILFWLLMVIITIRKCWDIYVKIM